MDFEIDLLLFDYKDISRCIKTTEQILLGKVKKWLNSNESYNKTYKFKRLIGHSFTLNNKMKQGENNKNKYHIRKNLP